MRILLSFIALIFGFSFSIAHADYQAGKRAYDAGNYEKAYQEWLPLAEAGNVEAQEGLGLVFFEKKPITYYYHLGVKWLYVAAQNGSSKSFEALEYVRLEFVPHNAGIAFSYFKGIKLGELWLTQSQPQ